MWVAISNRGMPIPYFRTSKSVTVNTEIYIKERLQPRLLPFIYKHHSDISFQFLHDLSEAHYSIETIAKMKENLPFGNNTTNHQNVPQVRPKKNLWVILAQKVYEERWKVTMQQKLISRIQSQLKNFDSSFLQSLMGGVITKLRAIADIGMLASYKR
jgi:hypothetical protein